MFCSLFCRYWVMLLFMILVCAPLEFYSADISLSGSVEIGQAVENSAWINVQLETPNPDFVMDTVDFLPLKNGQGFVAPIIKNGMMFFLDAAGYLQAMKISDRTYAWSAPIYHFGYMSAGLSASDEMLFCIIDNLIYALNLKTGEVKWRRELRSRVSGEPVVLDHKVAALTIDNYLYVFDDKDGSLVWSYQGTLMEQKDLNAASPSFKDGIIVVPFSNGEVLAFNSDRGREIWRYKFNSDFLRTPLNDVNLSPRIGTDFVILSNKSNNVARFELQSGKQVWSKKLNIDSMSGIVGNHVFILYNKDRLGALNIDSGKLSWNVQVVNKKKTKWNTPVVAANKLWLLDNDGSLLEINPNSGAVLSSKKLRAGSYQSPIFALSSMFLLTESGLIILS